MITIRYFDISRKKTRTSFISIDTVPNKKKEKVFKDKNDIKFLAMIHCKKKTVR